MYRLIGDNHALSGLSFSAQVFLRALESIRGNLARDAGVTGLELQVLGRIAEESGISEATVARYLEVTDGAAEMLADGLSNRGLLVRSTAPASGDDTTLTLTPEGHTLMQSVYLDFQESIETAADSLGENRQVALNSALLKMARKLDGAARAGSHGDADSTSIATS